MKFILFGQPLSFHATQRKKGIKDGIKDRLRGAFKQVMKGRALKKERVKTEFIFYFLEHTSGGEPDLDNLIKTYMDAMSGIVFTDDAQVVELKARKIIVSSYPFTEIHVSAAKTIRKI